MGCQFLQGWVILQANKWEQSSSYFGKGWGFLGIQPPPCFELQSRSWNHHGAYGCVIQLTDEVVQFTVKVDSSAILDLVVQLRSHVRLFVTPWTAARQASLSFTISGSLLKLMSIESVMPSNHLVLYCPLLLLSLIFSSIRIFSNELALHISWLKYYSFSFSISLSSEYSGLISFSIDLFDLLAVQGTLRSLLLNHS